MDHFTCTILWCIINKAICVHYYRLLAYKNKIQKDDNIKMDSKEIGWDGMAWT